MNKKQNTCPVTGKPIARRFPVHHTVLESCLKAGTVRANPRLGTLRRLIYVGGR
jgi:hypothetical protein